MNLPPSDFAATFRALVVPQLRPMIEARGLFVALGMDEYGDARSKIVRGAIRRGASNLPTPHLDALIEWIDVTLLAAIDAKEQPTADKVWRDVSAWNERVLAHFATPEVADAG